MTSNKNASYCYSVIDNYLKNKGRKWTLDELIDEISILPIFFESDLDYSLKN